MGTTVSLYGNERFPIWELLFPSRERTTFPTSGFRDKRIQTKKDAHPRNEERILFYLKCRRLLAAAGLQLLEEVVALVVHKDEGGEVFHLNLPDGFHAQFGIFHALDALDVVLC